MNRNYADGVSDNVDFFIGYEIEHTPAWGLKTLFITGLHSVETIEHLLKETNAEHLFFGANHSYNPMSPDDHYAWETMIKHFLSKDYLCSLDIPMNQVEEFHDGGLCDYNNFIPQIRVPIPYIKLWNYNTTIKIDDIGFNSTNAGVWSHTLHSLTNHENFTSWRDYRNDEIIR